MKKKRQDTILSLIAAEEIPTQEVLRERMEEHGFAVTQATLSRDIRELKLTKISLNDGRQKYAVMQASGVAAAGHAIRHRCGRKSTAAFCRTLPCVPTLPEMWQ